MAAGIPLAFCFVLQHHTCQHLSAGKQPASFKHYFAFQQLENELLCCKVLLPFCTLCSYPAQNAAHRICVGTKKKFQIIVTYFWRLRKSKSPLLPMNNEPSLTVHGDCHYIILSDFSTDIYGKVGHVHPIAGGPQ